MNRLEHLRVTLDELLRQVGDPETRRGAFVHLYGVSATAVLLARRRGLDEELASAAGLLHDLVSYETGDPSNHGPRSAARAGQILRSMAEYDEDEIQIVQSAIRHHSDKAGLHGRFDELLKDADVLHHDLYHMEHYTHPPHTARRDRLRESLD